MVGAGSMVAVFCLRSCVMVDLEVSGTICAGDSGVSSTQGIGWLACVGDLVSGGRQAGVG